LPNVITALEFLSNKFQYIFIVTNQQGIGKGIFSLSDLTKIHNYMLDEINRRGGRIDKIYIAPHLESENHVNRKPQPGMAWQAKNDFPDVDFKRSIMVGDSMLDMQFGENAGMTTVFLTNNESNTQVVADLICNDLYDFAMNGLNNFA